MTRRSKTGGATGAGEQTFDLLLNDLSLPDDSGLGLMRTLRPRA